MVSGGRPLFICLPYKMNNNPKNMTFNLGLLFRSGIRYFFTRPARSPYVLLNLVANLRSGVSMRSVNVSGLASTSKLTMKEPSKFINGAVRPFLNKACAIDSRLLCGLLGRLISARNVRLRPSTLTKLVKPDGLYDRNGSCLRVRNLARTVGGNARVI